MLKYRREFYRHPQKTQKYRKNFRNCWNFPKKHNKINCKKTTGFLKKIQNRNRNSFILNTTNKRRDNPVS